MIQHVLGGNIQPAIPRSRQKDWNVSLRNTAACAAFFLRAHPIGNASAMDMGNFRDFRRSAQMFDDARSRFHGAECSDKSYIVKRLCSDFRSRRSDFRALHFAMLKDWLKSALDHAHIGQAPLSRKLTAEIGRNIDRAAVNKMVKGGRGISADELLAIAKITGYPAPTSTPNEIADLGDANVKVTIKGFVQAGSWSENEEWSGDDWTDIQIAPVPEYPGIKLNACRVRGDSMDKVYPEGTVLVWINIIEAMEAPQSGKRYIVRQERNDGAEYETTVKTYVENSTGKWLMAESNNPEFQGPIKLANGTADTVQIIGRVVRSIREE